MEHGAQPGTAQQGARHSSLSSSSCGSPSRNLGDGLFGDAHDLQQLPSLAATLGMVALDPGKVSGKVEVDRVAEWVGIAVLRDAAAVMDALQDPLGALLELDADEGADAGPSSSAGTAVPMPGADCGCSDDTLSGYAGYNLGLAVLAAITGASADAAGLVITQHPVPLKRLAVRAQDGWHPDASTRVHFPSIFLSFSLSAGGRSPPLHCLLSLVVVAMFTFASPITPTMRKRRILLLLFAWDDIFVYYYSQILHSTSYL